MIALTQKLLAQAEGPVLIDFYADWCSPCRAIAPILKKIERDYEATVTFGKVDIDKEPKLAEKFKVRSIPTLILLQRDEVVGRIVGVGSSPEKDVRALLKKVA